MHEQTFDEWMAEVDALCEQEFLMPTEHFPDLDYRSAFDDGLTPKEMMDQFKDEQDFDFY